jgi:hypothetical protein
MTLAPGALVCREIERDFGQAYEILPRAITQNGLNQLG